MLNKLQLVLILYSVFYGYSLIFVGLAKNRDVLYLNTVVPTVVYTTDFVCHNDCYIATL